MSLSSVSAGRGEGRLWVIALGLSLLVNVAILGIAGFAALKTEIFRRSIAVPTPAPLERVAMIFPQQASPSAELIEKKGKDFARTSADQASPPPEKTDFIGERDTTATSDRAPDPNAPALPSQAGVERLRENDLETTESDYQDGRLNQDNAPKSPAATEASPPVNATDPAMASQSPPGEKTINPGNDESTTRPPPPEKLLEGPNPVDVPVPREVVAKDEIKPTPAQRKKDGSSEPKPAELPKPAVAKRIDDPAFAGYQTKAAIVGSISRTGRSALNVADTPLGRYQAIISKAVELEWQRNCVRHRDFITPGFLTVRFYVETSGKVRTVQFVGQMETGEVQKGFTLNSIRDAEIPAMPASLKKEYSKDPLELIFNFYF